MLVTASLQGKFGHRNKVKLNGFDQECAVILIAVPMLAYIAEKEIQMLAGDL